MERVDFNNELWSFRDHAWAYLMGIPAYKVLAELTGERLGTERGICGSMHFFYKKLLWWKRNCWGTGSLEFFQLLPIFC